jgi:hypothetical protein
LLGHHLILDNEVLVERIILILELAGELTENFLLASGRSRTAEPWITGSSSYPLDHEGFVDRKILELPDML